MKSSPVFYELPDRESEQIFAPSLRRAVEQERDVLGVDEAVELLDLSEVEAGYSSVGHPAYPPKVMVKVLVYGYALGMRSSRQLARACRLDLGFRFLTHGLEPDFRTICRFRRRQAEQLKGLFEQTVELCVEAGLVSLGHVAVDGTKLRANRSGDTLSKLLGKALQEAEAADADIEEDDAASEQGGEQEETAEAEESRFMKTSEGLKPCYNVQAAVDEAYQVIVAQEATTAEDDRGHLAPIVEQVKENCTAAPRKVSADGGYYSGQAVEAVDSEATQVYMPTPEPGGGRMQWVPEQAAYRCPMGHWLRPYRVRRGRQVYRTWQCAGCPQARACQITGKMKELHVPLADTALGRLYRRVRTAEGRAICAQRKRIVEPVFGRFKHNLGFRRLLLRGRIGASAECSLMCMVHNLLKLVGAGGCGFARLLRETDDQSILAGMLASLCLWFAPRAPTRIPALALAS
jgi:transposase